VNNECKQTVSYAQAMVSEDLKSLHIPNSKFVLGLQYLFYSTRKLTCKQFTCKVLKKIPGVPGPPLKVREEEVLKRDEGVEKEKTLGGGSGTRGRERREGRVWQVRGEEKMGSGVLLHALRRIDATVNKCRSGGAGRPKRLLIFEDKYLAGKFSPQRAVEWYLLLTFYSYLSTKQSKNHKSQITNYSLI